MAIRNLLSGCQKTCIDAQNGLHISHYKLPPKTGRARQVYRLRKNDG
jgi:hypothetical protein